MSVKNALYVEALRDSLDVSGLVPIVRGYLARGYESHAKGWDWRNLAQSVRSAAGEENSEGAVNAAHRILGGLFRLPLADWTDRAANNAAGWSDREVTAIIAVCGLSSVNAALREIVTEALPSAEPIIAKYLAMSDDGDSWAQCAAEVFAAIGMDAVSGAESAAGLALGGLFRKARGSSVYPHKSASPATVLALIVLMGAFAPRSATKSNGKGGRVVSATALFGV